MTILEIQTHVMEIIAELKTNEENSASIREKLMELVKEM